MEPITREEMYLAAAAGEYSGELPEPKTRLEYYLKKIKEAVENGSSVAPEDIDAAIEAYLNSHDADIVTEAELTDALEGKADSADIPDVSGFIGADVNNLTNYYDKDTIDAALAEKQATLIAGENISITDLTISATDTTYSVATTSADGLMSAADKAKLDGIAATAEVNVQADWSQTNSEADDYIQNKPDLSIYAESAAVTTALSGKVDKETNKSLMTADEHTKLFGIETGAQVNTVTGVKGSNEADYRTGNVSITKGNVGLGNVDNTADADKPISTAAQTALDGKVDKITGKGLSEANFTDTEKTKLAGIATGAEVNVQSDWNQGNDAADDYIKNKPSNLVQDASYVHTDNNFSNAEKAKADGAIQSTEKGVANGVAELDEYGHVPVSQLPSFVSDVIEGYYDSETTYKFYADAQHQTEIQGQSNKIYVDVNTNLSYRWSGSVFAEVSPSLALGSTDSTAYRGDWGTADHAAIGILASLNTSEKSSLVAAINELQSGSVSVDPDRGLSENDFTDSLKSKLDGIESGAEVNVQSDWNQTVTTADDFIKNKPENLVRDASYVHTDNNYTTGEKTKLAGISSGAQVNTVTGVKGNAENDYRTGDINISPANIGLGNVNNTSDANKPISTATQAALNAKQDALTAGDNVSIATVNGVLTVSATDTTYSDATQQTHGLMSTADKTKLDGIATGAEVNVQSDWNQGDDAADDYIRNKPANLVQDASYVHTDNNFTNAEKAKADGAIQSTEKGTANGVAELDSNGKVPSSQLPSYVDDVLEYTSKSNFPATGETGKIYVDTATNLTYRWSGRAYTEISPSLALGETSSTAYRGDRGASAYAHAVTNKGSAFVSGLYKITTNSEGHVTAATSVTKSDITGLGIPAQDTNTDTKVTSAANHYAPAEDASAVLSADASGSTAATWNSTSLVTGVDIKRDAKGHVVGVAVDSVKMPANPNTNTTYSAGTGLSLSGTTFNHSNSVTAGTAQGDASKTLTFGGTFTVPTITYDAQGHITAKGSTTMTMPANPNTNNAVAQTATTTSADYEVLFSATADNTTRTEGARKNSNLKFNPSTGNLQVTKINGVAVGNAPKFTDNNTTYSAGTGLSLSGTTFSNAAPNVKSDWNAAAGTDAEILNKPTIPNYSNATTSAAGLMSATDKSTLNAINAGTQVSLMPYGGIDLVSASNNRLTLSSAVSNFRAIEIRYAMCYTGASTYTNIVRAVSKDGQGDYGNIAALVVRADTAGSLSLYMCNLQLSGSNLTLSAVNNIPSFYVYNVWGYK